jgi:pyrimidine deaminase RibD-like protein
MAAQLAESTDETHLQYMRAALDEARKAIPVENAFCVGCVIVDEEGSDGPRVISTGYSRELPGNTHAEANALAKLQNSAGTLRHCSVYTTMEPCSVRLSGLAPCSDGLINAGARKVLIGTMEPNDFVNCTGIQKLLDAGIPVIWVRGLEEQCLSVARGV